MRFQFATRTFLLATVATAISVWGYIDWYRVEITALHLPGEDWPLLHEYFIDSLIWIPLIFAAYSLGRRSVTLWPVVIFTIAEACAVWFWCWTNAHYWHH